MESADAEQVVHMYVTAFNAKDRDGWLGLFAPDALHEDPIGRPARRGHDEIAAFWDRAFSRARSITLEPSLVIATQHEATMVAVVRSVQEDRTDAIDAVDFFALDDQGMIKSLRAFARLRSRAPR